jgi:hypothetical protein
MQALDDMELLRAYATRNSEAAFEALVARHIHWVYSAALRQVRDPQVAEEVAQAVFTILRQAAMHATEEFGPLGVRRAAPQVIDGLTETEDRHNNYAVSGARWLLLESAKALAMLRRNRSTGGLNDRLLAGQPADQIGDGTLPAVPAFRLA